jgi:23S rRNA pseudouridine1911/1915/1917 synthase
MNQPLPPAFASYSVLELLGVLHPLWSRDTLDGLFAGGRVRSAGQPVGARRLTRELADLEIVGGTAELPEIWAPGTPCGVEVLFEDERTIAISKPSGVPVTPDRQSERESCLGFLLRRELAARETKPVDQFFRVRVLHRLDRLTSGLVIFAKTPAAERELARLFEERRVQKDYVAIVVGNVLPARITIDSPIETGRKGRMRTGRSGKPAQTTFEPLERFGDLTLVRVSPRTGRTHQIRIHALAIGHPLAVDPLYRPSQFDENARPDGIERLTLHARSCTLPSDWDGQRTFTCEPPPDFEAALRTLREKA